MSHPIAAAHQIKSLIEDPAEASRPISEQDLTLFYKLFNLQKTMKKCKDAIEDSVKTAQDVKKIAREAAEEINQDASIPSIK